MIAFPTTPPPQVNDTYTAAGKTWRWTGTVWQLQPRALTSADITDFNTAVGNVAPPTTNASLLTSGTLPDARLSAVVTASLGKADTALQPVSVGYAGPYNNGADYGINAVVLFNGRLYKKISNPNNPGYPPTGSDWGLFEPEIGSPAYDLWVQTALDGKQAAGSYATLDANGKVPTSQLELPSYVDDVIEAADFASLPATGETGKIYVTIDTKKTYRWSGSAYVEISASPGSTDAVTEGTNNLYHTAARAAAAAPVQSVAGKTGAVTLTTADIDGLGSIVAGGGALSAPLQVLDVEQGAYANGETIPAGTSFETIIKKMLQKEVAAVYQQPSVSFSASGSTTREFGSDISTTLTGSFTRGDAGALTAYRVKEDGAVVLTETAVANYTTSFQLTASKSFVSEADYATGQQLNNNMGNPSGTPIQAGTKTSNTVTFTPARGSFYGADTETSAAATSTQVRNVRTNPVLGLQNGSTFAITVPVGTRRITIAYPATLRPLTSVAYVESGNAPVKDTFTETTVSVQGANGSTAIDYRVYTYIPAIAFGSEATYNVTI